MVHGDGPRRPSYPPQDPYGATGRRVPLSESSERAAPAPAQAALAAQLEALTARVAELEAQLAAEHGKAESFLDLAQRTQADFVNYKRRVERERGEEIAAAQAELLAQLLPVLDDLERALSHVPPDLREHPWAAGLPLVARQLRLALARAGVQRVGAPGEPFDPRLHEAVGQERGTPYPDGHVAEVVQPGYRLRDRLIRPARVVVARGEPSGA